MAFLKYEAGQEEPLLKYDPDQPRDPKGVETGGQWTGRGRRPRKKKEVVKPKSGFELFLESKGLDEAKMNALSDFESGKILDEFMGLPIRKPKLSGEALGVGVKSYLAQENMAPGYKSGMIYSFTGGADGQDFEFSESNFPVGDPGEHRKIAQRAYDAGKAFRDKSGIDKG